MEKRKGEQKMKKTMGVAALMLALVCVFAGCDFKAEKEYEANLQTILGEITSSKQAVDDSMQSSAGSIGNATEITEDTFKPVLEKIEAAEEKCKALSALEAPEKYKETQKLLKQSADKMLEAYSKYREGMSKMVGAGADIDMDSITKLLTDGDSAMTEAGKIMTEAGNLQTK